jgi:hypothetical protein
MEFQTLYFYIIKFSLNVKQKTTTFSVAVNIVQFILYIQYQQPPHSQFVNVCHLISVR